MKNDCPPRIVLEASFLEGKESPGLKDHIRACRSCQGALKALESERAVFLQRYPFSQLWKGIEPAMKMRKASFFKRLVDSLILTPKVLGPALAMAGLAGIMIVTLWQNRFLEPQIQVKGGVGLSFYYAGTDPDAEVKPGKDGMDLPAGTQVQFVYSNSENPYLLLVGVEQDGTVTTYFSGSIQKGTRITLPQGLRWEPKSGYERFYALFSQQPVTTDEVRGAMNQPASDGKTVEQATKLPLPYPQASILVHRKNGK